MPADTLTVPETGQLLSLTPYQVLRLITLRQLPAGRDARGWWRVSRMDAEEYAARTATQPAPAA